MVSCINWSTFSLICFRIYKDVLFVYSLSSFVLFNPLPFLYSFIFYCSLQKKKKKYLLSVVKAQSQNEKTSHCMQDADGGWSIMHHLLGCCQIGQAHYKLHGPLKERKVHEAICSFFRYYTWLRILSSSNTVVL